MRHTSKTILSMSFVCILATVLLAPVTAISSEPALVPWPTSISMGSGTLTITGSNQILYADAELEDLANLFAGEVFDGHGISLSTAFGSSVNPGDILLKLVTDPLLTGEKYRLTVDTYATIEAESIEGISPGTTTLLQAMTKNGSEVTVPEMTIFDEPYREMRSHMIDIKNHWHEVDTIKMFIRMCRFYKIRHFCLHTGEWQWIGAVMNQTSGIPYSQRKSFRLYTKEEMEDLIAYGKARGVYLYPHNESVPHYNGMEYALETDFNSSDGYDNFMDEWDGLGSYSHNKSSPSSRYWNFIKEVTHRAMDQFAVGFPDGRLPYYHVGPVQGEGGMDRSTAATMLGYITDHDPDTKMAFWSGINAATSDSLSAQKSKCLVFYYDNAQGGSSAAGCINNGWEIVNSAWSPLYIVNQLLRTQQQVYEDWNMYRQGDDGIPGGYETITWEFFDNPSTHHLVVGGNMSTWETPEAGHLDKDRVRFPAYAEHVWHHKPWPYASGDYPHFEGRYQTTNILLERILTGPPGEIDVSPTGPLNFGDKDINEGPTSPQTVTITNTHATDDLRLLSVSLTGADADDFEIDTDTREDTLGSGESRNIEIVFDPESIGVKLASLTIISNDYDEAVVDISLSGTAILNSVVTDVCLNSSDNIEITFEKPGRTFRIESSTSPYDYDESNMTWVEEATGLSGGTWEDTNAPSSGEKYYHVIPEGAIILPLAYESFDYASGIDVDGLSGGEGWSDAWNVPPDHDHSETIHTSGLSYPGLPTSGRALRVTPLSDTPSSVTERNMVNSIGTNGTTVWVSYLFHAINMGSGGAFFEPNAEWRTMFGKKWGSEFAINNQPGVLATEGETYLLVARYDYYSGDDDVWLWVDPDLSEEPNPDAANSEIHENSDMRQGTKILFSVAGWGQNDIVIDEIRIGTTWQSLIGTQFEPAETVGIKVTSLTLSRNLVSSPFEPYPDGGIGGGGTMGQASLDKIVGDQLTGHAVSQWASDKIEAWDADLQTYVGAWLRTGQGWTAWDTMDSSPAFGIDSDAGYWIKINNVAKDVKLFGRVAKENRSIEMKMNRNMVGNCFPVSCPLTQSNLVSSGFNGHAVSQWASDKIEFWNGAGQTYVGVWYRSGQGWRAWDSMDNPPATPYDAIDPCEGWWIKVNNTPFTWGYPRPN